MPGQSVERYFQYCAAGAGAPAETTLNSGEAFLANQHGHQDRLEGGPDRRQRTMTRVLAAIRAREASSGPEGFEDRPAAASSDQFRVTGAARLDDQ